MTSTEIRDMLFFDRPTHEVCESCADLYAVYASPNNSLHDPDRLKRMCRGCWLRLIDNRTRQKMGRPVVRQRQKRMLTGLNLLPGQQDLINTDGSHK